MSRMHRTPKGTDLPLLNLRGKEYLEVKYRVVWFREEHPDWAIETELLSVTGESAYSRATVKDQSGRVIATSHKFENKQGFPDFIEKSETGAIGRALALIGYGTQFCADELDEGERIVDSPNEPKFPQPKGPAPTPVKSTPSATAVKPQEPPWNVDPAMEDLGEYKVPATLKFGGFRLKDLKKSDIKASIDYWYDRASSDGKKAPDGLPGKFVEHAEAYLKQVSG